MSSPWSKPQIPRPPRMIRSPSCEPGEKPGYGQTWGRFFSLWSHCGCPAWFPFEERLVASDTSDDCPNLYYYEQPASFECGHGLCQNTDTDEFPRDELAPYYV